MNLEKLAKLMADESGQQDETHITSKVAGSASNANDTEEAVVKVAAEAYALGKIVAFGCVDQLGKTAAEMYEMKEKGMGSTDASDTAEGGKGSIAKDKGDKLPENMGGVPADDKDHKLTEKDLMESPAPVDSKGDSQGKGIGKEGSTDSLSALAAALGA